VNRSWVYQEFLSATSIHFISGPVSVPWSELSPLVEFICEGLDQFMEDIRKHFESQITEEMKQKDREEREIERNLRREEQRRQWQREQRKAREEEKRKRREREEKRRRHVEDEREKRKIEAKREAQRLCQERLERFGEEQRRFEAERLTQWKAALQQQLYERIKFEAQQRFQVQQELTRLSEEKVATKTSLHPISAVRRHRMMAHLRKFQIQVMKPIDEQIADAVHFFEGTLDSDTAVKLDRQCGWRLYDSRRIHKLMNFTKIPDDPRKFISETLKSPTRPIESSPPASLDLSFDQYVGRSQESFQRGSNDIHSMHSLDDRFRPGSRRSLKRSTTVVSISDLEDKVSDPEPERSDEKTDFPDEEPPQEQQSVSLERLGAREIEQRDKIIHLQDDFRRLDRSALASMAKGKKDFRRDSELIALLRHSRNCEASDPRDRVYAFVGLAEPGYNIVPDYRTVNKLERVLIETAKRVIHHDQSLAILQHVHRGRAKLVARLPSWVPDWTSKETVYGIDQYEWESVNPFNAGKGSHAIAEFQRYANDGFYEDLKARGVLVGKIVNIEVDSELEHVSSLILADGEWVFGPKAARYDDEVWVLHGATRPVVLRPEGNDRFGYLGDALVCEDVANVEQTTFSPIMYGQMIGRAQEGMALEKDIWII
jgi:hypothetical protein